MAELVKQWNDGGSLTATYEGSGDGSAVFSSDGYEGIDREMSVFFKGNGLSVERKVRQEGTRQQFITADGLVFRCADGGRFGVLKEEHVITLPYSAELEYLEATGTQYINLGLVSTKDSKIDIEFGFSNMETSAAQTTAVFGGRNSNMSNTFTLFKYATYNPQYFRFDLNGQHQLSSSTNIVWDTTSKYGFIYNGELAISFNATTNQRNSTIVGAPTTFTSSPICLFCVNTNGTPEKHMSGRIYRCTYSDGITTIDLIPVLDKEGVACMYDKVSGEFFYNQGSGEFSYKLLN